MDGWSKGSYISFFSSIRCTISIFLDSRAFAPAIIHIFYKFYPLHMTKDEVIRRIMPEFTKNLWLLNVEVSWFSFTDCRNFIKNYKHILFKSPFWVYKLTNKKIRDAEEIHQRENMIYTHTGYLRLKIRFHFL